MLLIIRPEFRITPKNAEQYFKRACMQHLAGKLMLIPNGRQYLCKYTNYANKYAYIYRIISSRLSVCIQGQSEYVLPVRDKASEVTEVAKKLFEYLTDRESPPTVRLALKSTSGFRRNENGDRS